MAIILFFAFFLSLNQSWAEETNTSMSDLKGHEVSSGREVSKTISLDYISWQEQGKIKAGAADSHLIVTNKAVCAGGSIGYKTARYRQFLDGCFFYGSGNVGSDNNSITYNESDISVSGIKAALGAGAFVSSAKAEIGFKIPVMYRNQSLSKPAGSSLREPPDFLAMGSLYSRWPFNKWFFQTEFSKIVGNDYTLFSLGAGYEF